MFSKLEGPMFCIPEKGNVFSYKTPVPDFEVQMLKLNRWTYEVFSLVGIGHWEWEFFLLFIFLLF